MPVHPMRLHFRLAALISGSGRTLKNFIDLAAEDRLPVDVRVGRYRVHRRPADFSMPKRRASRSMRVVSRDDYDSPRDYGAAIFAACRELPTSTTSCHGGVSQAGRSARRF